MSALLTALGWILLSIVGAVLLILALCVIAMMIVVPLMLNKINEEEIKQQRVGLEG